MTQYHLRSLPPPQGKLDQVRSEADSSRSQLTSTQFSEKALKARVKELEGQVAKRCLSGYKTRHAVSWVEVLGSGL